jgi:succinoglycan biosynthesis protein ExoM
MSTPVPGTVSICIATYRRNEKLRALLADLAAQVRVPEQVVIVDNDATCGARRTVDEFRATRPPFVLDYDMQPEPNIAMTRNRTVELATGEWLAFLDDDERAPKEWLQRILEAARTFSADVILAPVEPQVPASAPAWIRRGRFYDFAHQPNGAPVPYNCLRFGNVLLRGQCVRADSEPFDPRWGLAPGEDLDMLMQLARKGARIIWSEDAPVFEPIETKRLSLKWLMMRAYSGGQGGARALVRGEFGPISTVGRCLFYAGVLARLLTAALLTLLTLPIGRHHAAAWLIKVAANYGKIASLWMTSQYATYARKSGPQAGVSTAN